MPKFLIIANWKSNPTNLTDALRLARDTEGGIVKNKNVEVVIAPPFPFLAEVGGVLKKTKLGAQDAYPESGPFTGEVSWKQLEDAGVEYVIIGHSERKNLLGETDEIINLKVKSLLKQKAKVILCVGENKREGSEIPEIVGDQLKKALEGVNTAGLKNLTIAYEPVWAISTNLGAKPDTPHNAFQAMVYIKKILAGLYGRTPSGGIKVIYGGSVKSSNIVDFLKDGRMEGALVGGASLRAEEFSEMVEKAAHLGAD